MDEGEREIANVDEVSQRYVHARRAHVRAQSTALLFTAIALITYPVTPCWIGAFCMRRPCTYRMRGAIALSITHSSAHWRAAAAGHLDLLSSTQTTANAIYIICQMV